MRKINTNYLLYNQKHMDTIDLSKIKGDKPKIGDIVVRLWKNWARLAHAGDTMDRVMGFYDGSNKPVNTMNMDIYKG